MGHPSCHLQIFGKYQTAVLPNAGLSTSAFPVVASQMHLVEWKIPKVSTERDGTAGVGEANRCVRCPQHSTRQQQMAAFCVEPIPGLTERVGAAAHTTPYPTPNQTGNLAVVVAKALRFPPKEDAVGLADAAQK